MFDDWYNNVTPGHVRRGRPRPYSTSRPIEVERRWLHQVREINRVSGKINLDEVDFRRPLWVVNLEGDRVIARLAIPDRKRSWYKHFLVSLIDDLFFPLELDIVFVWTAGPGLDARRYKTIA